MITTHFYLQKKGRKWASAEHLFCGRQGPGCFHGITLWLHGMQLHQYVKGTTHGGRSRAARQQKYRSCFPTVPWGMVLWNKMPTSLKKSKWQETHSPWLSPSLEDWKDEVHLKSHYHRGRNVVSIWKEDIYQVRKDVPCEELEIEGE